MDNTAIRILNDAKKLMKTVKHASWQDYTNFKNRLIDSGCYGYERELCNILHL